MRSAVGPVPEVDTTAASQSSCTKVLARGGSFRDVCGELIGVIQDHPVQSPPFIDIRTVAQRKTGDGVTMHTDETRLKNRGRGHDAYG